MVTIAGCWRNPHLELMASSAPLALGGWQVADLAVLSEESLMPSFQYGRTTGQQRGTPSKEGQSASAIV